MWCELNWGRNGEEMEHQFRVFAFRSGNETGTGVGRAALRVESARLGACWRLDWASRSQRCLGGLPPVRIGKWWSPLPPPSPGRVTFWGGEELGVGLILTAALWWLVPELIWLFCFEVRLEAVLFHVFFHFSRCFTSGFSVGLAQWFIPNCSN